MPSTNSVLGSRTGQACITKALKLNRAFSVFTASKGNSVSTKYRIASIEFFFFFESGVINRALIYRVHGVDKGSRVAASRAGSLDPAGGLAVRSSGRASEFSAKTLASRACWSRDTFWRIAIQSRSE